MQRAGPKTSFHATKSAHRDEQPSIDVRLAALAERQHGVAALSQLEALGLSASGVRTRVAAGRLHRIHRGVYSIGHRVLNREGRWLAAVMACGPKAALSHRSAAALWGIRPSNRPAVDVVAPSRRGRGRAGIDVHRAASLAAGEVTSLLGIPCTTVERTLFDLARTIDRQALARAVAEAEVLRVFDLSALEAMLARATGLPGSRSLRAVVSHFDPQATLTRSELERRFLGLCRSAGLPLPKVNAFVELRGKRFEVDFLWRPQRLAVEADSWRFHSSRSRFEQDRRRDQMLMLAGWRVLRCTWNHVVGDPAELARTLRHCLSPAVA